MCTRFTKKTVAGWIDSQIAVLDCWLDSESLASSEDSALIELLSRHQSWLREERGQLDVSEKALGE